MWVLIVLLLLAAALGVLGFVLKVAAAIALGLVLTVIILVAGSYWYLRYRVNRFVREVERRRTAYPTRGEKRPSDPELPPH
jgi:uncharacterized membrane protein YphA (DoxX/SURF4 family)